MPFAFSYDILWAYSGCYATIFKHSSELSTLTSLPIPKLKQCMQTWNDTLTGIFFCCQCNNMKQAKLHSSFLFSAIKAFTRRSYITWTALLWVGLLIVSLWCSLQSSPDLPMVLTPVVLLTPITVMHRRAWLRLLWMFIFVAPVDLFSWPRANTCTEGTCTRRV